MKVVIDYSYGSASLAMPNVLAKLGAEVLAVNPYVSTAGMLGFDRIEHAKQVAALVTASGADLGAVVDPSGDQLTLIDGDGAVLSDTESLFCFLELLGPTGARSTDTRASKLEGASAVVLPVNAPRAARAILEDQGLELRWSKTSAPSIMAEAEESGVLFAMNLEGGVILPEFMPAFDAAAGLLKMLDLLTRHEVSLSELRNGAPAAHLVHETVVTPWEEKGLVMRTLVEQTHGRDVELIDGVKVNHDHGWVLVLPDPEDPKTHIWAEGDSASEAKALTQEYSRRLRQMVR
jgi:mannose-1-phosphate guanylyltransferase/phosphomannomutase